MRWYFKVPQARIHITLGRIISSIAISWLTFYFCLSQTIASFGASLYPDVFVRFPDNWTLIGQFALVLVSLFILIGLCLTPKLLLNNEVPKRAKIGYLSFLILVALVLIWSTYFNMLFFNF
ncbi:MAG: hypothetical protein OQK04_04720, partial [Kangiellaceae bacterium]|nr:hypothetical protein [Kangiellaceae bacterium]